MAVKQKKYRRILDGKLRPLAVSEKKAKNAKMTSAQLLQNQAKTKEKAV